MKIWIDDIRNAPDESWMVCRTVTSAVNAMHQFSTEITEISFDHDISHQVTVGESSRPLPCNETFRPAAHYLGLLYKEHESRCAVHGNGGGDHDWNPIITVHSANPVGGREIYNILNEYGLESMIDALAQVNRLEMTI